MNLDNQIKDTSRSQIKQEFSNDEDIRHSSQIPIFGPNQCSNKTIITDENQIDRKDFDIQFALGEINSNIKMFSPDDSFKINFFSSQNLIKNDGTKPAQNISRKRNFQNIYKIVPENNDLGLFVIPDEAIVPPPIKKKRFSIDVSKSINKFVKSLEKNQHDQNFEYGRNLDLNSKKNIDDGLDQKKTIKKNFQETQNSQKQISEQIKDEMNNWLDSTEVLSELQFLTKKKLPASDQQLYHTLQQEYLDQKPIFDEQIQSNNNTNQINNSNNNNFLGTNDSSQ